MPVRLFALAGFALASMALTASPASADPYRWCAQYGRDGGRNCGFVTIQQCLATVSGIGGYCEPNPFYTGPERSYAREPTRAREPKPQRTKRNNR